MTNEKKPRLMAERRIMPSMDRLHPWEHYAEELLVEYRQCEEEGLDVAPYKAMFETVQQMPQGEFRERFADLLGDMVLNLPMREDYPFDEPNALEEIRARRNLSLWQDAPVF